MSEPYKEPFINIPRLQRPMPLSDGVIDELMSDPLCLQLEKSRKILGFYSVNEDGNFLPNHSERLIIRPEFLPKDDDPHLRVIMDLNKRDVPYYSVTPRSSFFGILEWIIQNKEKITPLSDKSDDNMEDTVEFVALHNVITLVFMTPYDFKMEYSFYAIRYKGKIYMMRDFMDSDLEEKFTGQNLNKYGHNFKAYLTKGVNPLAPVSSINGHYRGVFKVKIRENNLIISRKMDFIEKDIEPESIKDFSAFIETFSMKKPNEDHQLKTFSQFKLVKPFCIGLLSGMHKSLVGFRDDNNFITDIQLLTTKKIMFLAEGRVNPVFMLKFGSDFFDQLKLIVNKEGSCCKITKTSRTPFVTFTRMTEEQSKGLIPDWFKEEMGYL